MVVSLGAEGMLLVLDATGPARGIRARLPKPLHGNATGAGDAAVAAIAAALVEHPELRAAGDGDAAADTTAARIAMARRATAWSASAVLMPLAGALSPDHAALEAEVVVTTLEPQDPA